MHHARQTQSRRFVYVCGNYEWQAAAEGFSVDLFFSPFLSVLFQVEPRVSDALKECSTTEMAGVCHYAWKDEQNIISFKNLFILFILARHGGAHL